MSVNAAVKAAMAGVELAEHKLTAFQYAIHNVRRDQTHNKGLEDSINTVWAALYADCLEAYRRVFMWGCVVGDDTRAAAKKIALDRFLHEHMSVMQFLHPEGIHPSMWASAEEKKFREEIERLAKKKVKKA
jgi:hypothetical protein